MRGLLFWVYIRTPDFWKVPYRELLGLYSTRWRTHDPCRGRLKYSSEIRGAMVKIPYARPSRPSSPALQTTSI